MPGCPTFANASRAPPAGRSAIPPQSGSLPSRRRFPPTTFAPPPTPDRLISAKTKSRKGWRRLPRPRIFHFAGISSDISSRTRRSRRSRSTRSSQSIRAPLLQKVEQVAAGADRTVDVLIQVDLANEPTKYGVQPAGLRATLEVAEACKAVRLRGLMLLPPAFDDPEGGPPVLFRAPDAAG